MVGAIRTSSCSRTLMSTGESPGPEVEAPFSLPLSVIMLVLANPLLLPSIEVASLVSGPIPPMAAPCGVSADDPNSSEEDMVVKEANDISLWIDLLGVMLVK